MSRLVAIIMSGKRVLITGGGPRGPPWSHPRGKGRGSHPREAAVSQASHWESLQPAAFELLDFYLPASSSRWRTRASRASTVPSTDGVTTASSGT